MSQLSDRQLRAIEALLMSASVEDAARRSGLSARTVHRYLSSAEFAEAFRERLRTRVDVASARLQSATGDAVECLIEVMNDQSASHGVRTKAAVSVIELSWRWLEANEFEDRLSALEQSLPAVVR